MLPTETTMDILLLRFTALVAWLSLAQALECYVCHNQPDNKDKCIKTTAQCEEEGDSCMSIIRWGMPPYWTPHGDRVFYISKWCQTRTGCQDEKARLATWCKRDWYNDWECAECCSGDLCNYYVTLGAAELRVGAAVTLGIVACAAVVNFCL